MPESVSPRRTTYVTLRASPSPLGTLDTTPPLLAAALSRSRWPMCRVAVVLMPLMRASVFTLMPWRRAMVHSESPLLTRCTARTPPGRRESTRAAARRT